MDIRTTDGIDIFMLPDLAKCMADEENRSPLILEECPDGEETCHPDCCPWYQE